MTTVLKLSLVSLAGALLAAPAKAQDDEPASDDTLDEEQALEADITEDAPRESKGPWKPRPYLRPAVMGVAYSGSGGTDYGAALGLEAGVAYKQQNGALMGRTRVAGTYILASGGSGNDVRVGTFMGVRPKLYGAELGLDIFRNQYAGDAVDLAPTTGTDFPTIRVELGPEQFYLLGGVTATWLGDAARQVIWSQVDKFGFGHEFEWRAGAALNVAALKLSATYVERTVAGGTSQGISFGVGVGF